MAVIRGPLPQDGYLIAERAWFRDPRLTHKAMGLLGSIVSHAPDWELTTDQLVRESADGRAAVLSGLQELERVGYLRRVKMRRSEDEGGRRRAGTFAGYDYQLCVPPPYEKPAPAGSVKPTATTNRKSAGGPDQGLCDPTTDRFSSSGKPSSGKSTTKKTRGLEDQGEKTPPTPRATAPAQRAGGSQTGGDSPTSKPDPDQVRSLVGELVAIRPDWRYVAQRVDAALAEIGDAHPFPVIRLALLDLAADISDPTESPKRVCHDGPWWARAYAAELAARPPSQATQQRRQCHRCDDAGWVLDVEPAVRCPHPDLVAAVT